MGEFLRATLLQVSLGFKHAHWGFAAVQVGAAVSDPALRRPGLFVAVGEVSFHDAWNISGLFLGGSLESGELEGGAKADGKCGESAA